MKLLSIKALPICLVVFGFCQSALGYPTEEPLRNQATISFRWAGTEVTEVTLPDRIVQDLRLERHPIKPVKR